MKFIDILKIVHLRGPNQWTYRPVLEAWVDIHDLEDCPSHTLPGFNERLVAWLPTLQSHRCSYGEEGGFVKRLEEGTWPAHIMEHVALELQNLAGMPGGFGRARSLPQRGQYRVVVRAWHPEVTREAIYAARDLVMAAIEDKPFDVAGAVKRLNELADRRLLGPSTACIVEAADAKPRRIPHIRLNDGNLVQLGYGSQSRRIWTAETDATSAIAESIASDKDLTKRLLAAAGVPVPEGRLVASPADAWEAAQEIGLPVVVKPDNANHGRGVSLDLKSQAEIEAAFPVADAEGSGVMVERFVPGEEHRLLVVGDALVAASRGESIYIVGDGRASVRELIDSQLNTDPRRGEAETFPLETIVLEREPGILLLLERQGLGPDAVPAAGQQVLIQRTGTYAEDVTDLVHADTARLACLAAKIVGLDIAGIDLVCEDIAKPLVAQGGAIVEVNAGPGLLMHLKPAVGRPRPVGEAIVAHLFPNGGNGRIPVVGVAGDRHATLAAKIVAHLVRIEGKRTGLSCAAGLFLDRRLVQAGDCARWEPARRLLMNRNVDVAVIENPLVTLVSEGLAYDRCQIGVVTDIDLAARWPEHGIEDEASLLRVWRTQVDVVLPNGCAVLNAADAAVADLAECCDGETVLFSVDPAAPPLDRHRDRGRRAVLAVDGRIVLASGGMESVLVELSAIALAEADLPAVLGALGAGWALGLAPELLRAGIETFGKVA